MGISRIILQDYHVGSKGEAYPLVLERFAPLQLGVNLFRSVAPISGSVPQVSGQITTVAGYYSLFGRRFRIRYGNIQFQGQATLNPLLDINAERTVRGKVLRAGLAGSTLGFRGTSGPTIPGEQYEVDRNTFYLHIVGTFNSPQFDITVRDREDREIEPPLTEELLPSAVLSRPPLTDEQSPSASLLWPPLIDEPCPRAMFSYPPLMQAVTANISLLRPPRITA